MTTRGVIKDIVTVVLLLTAIGVTAECFLPHK